VVGEQDTPDLIIDPFAHFEAPGPCDRSVAPRGSPEADPYFLHHDAGGRRSLAIQQLLFPSALAPVSPCLCRAGWNRQHSKCRKRHKKCTVLSLNFPIVPRSGTFAHTVLEGVPTVYHRRAFWALGVDLPDPLRRSAVVQRALWGLGAVPVFHNASNYLPRRPGPTPTRPGWCASLSAKKSHAHFKAAADVPLDTDGTLADDLRRMVGALGTAADCHSLRLWLDDLATVGYALPAKLRAEATFAAAVVMLDESARDVMRHAWYWNAIRFLRRRRYPLWLFHIDGTLAPKERGIILERLPGLDVRFLPIQYFIPRRFWASHNNWTLNGTKGYGYFYCSQFLGYEMFKHPMFLTLRYFFRFDEDTHPFIRPNGTIVPLLDDPFPRMQARALRFVTPQEGVLSPEADNSLSDRTDRYIASGALSSVGPLWSRARSFFPRYGRRAWDRFVYAGCAEAAEVNVFRTDRYFAFLSSIDWLEGVYRHSWLEQAFKTVWVLLTVPDHQWAYMCDLVLQHKNRPTGPLCSDLANARRFPLQMLLAGKTPASRRFLSKRQK